jgi:hypothetical protein
MAHKLAAAVSKRDPQSSCSILPRKLLQDPYSPAWVSHTQCQAVKFARPAASPCLLLSTPGLSSDTLLYKGMSVAESSTLPALPRICCCGEKLS